MLCIGAYDSVNRLDLSSQFVEQGKAFINYSEEDGKYLNQALSKASAGSLIAIKSWSPSNGLYIKAVGIIKTEATLRDASGPYRDVKWLWSGNESFGRPQDNLGNTRNGTLYHEMNTDIIQRIIRLIA